MQHIFTLYATCIHHVYIKVDSMATVQNKILNRFIVPSTIYKLLLLVVGSLRLLSVDTPNLLHSSLSAPKEKRQQSGMCWTENIDVA